MCLKHTFNSEVESTRNSGFVKGSVNEVVADIDRVGDGEEDGALDSAHLSYC